MAAKPVLTMIAGPNGSGKSTLTRELVARGVELGRYINADEIDATLPGRPSEDRSRRAQALADEARRECLEQGISFAFETVMSHPSKIDVLRQARQRGYSVVMFFVALESSRLNVERVRQRVFLGGHPVPEDRIVARYERTLALLPEAIAQCDRAVLFDNSYRITGAGAVQFVPVCEVRRVERQGRMTFALADGRGRPLERLRVLVDRRRRVRDAVLHLPQWAQKAIRALESDSP